MKKNESMKICRICGVTAENDGTVFEKHRNVCRKCRAKYHKNRRKDLSDGVRDEANWYKAEDELSNANTIKKLEAVYNRRTNVKQLPDHELRYEDTSRLEWLCIGSFFLLIVSFVVYTIVEEICKHLGCF